MSDRLDKLLEAIRNTPGCGVNWEAPLINIGDLISLSPGIVNVTTVWNVIHVTIHNKNRIILDMKEKGYQLYKQDLNMMLETGEAELFRLGLVRFPIQKEGNNHAS